MANGHPFQAVIFTPHMLAGVDPAANPGALSRSYRPAATACPPMRRGSARGVSCGVACVAAMSE
jgi:hypothetical protein